MMSYHMDFGDYANKVMGPTKPKICINCGHENHYSAKFCVNCGLHFD
jgi:hypothetical protein